MMMEVFAIYVKLISEVNTTKEDILPVAPSSVSVSFFFTEMLKSID